VRRRLAGLVAVCAMVWFPLTYSLFVGLLVVARLLVGPDDANLLAAPAALVLGTLAVVGLGRALWRDLGARTGGARRTPGGGG
jgi:hypothetical protein